MLGIQSHPVFASAGGKKQQPDGNDATASTESVVSKAKPGGVIAALSQRVAPKNKTLFGGLVCTPCLSPRGGDVTARPSKGKDKKKARIPPECLDIKTIVDLNVSQ